MADEKRILFINWCAKDALEGTHMLEPLEDLAYRIIIDLIYSTNDKLPDDDKRLARMTKTGRKWKSIKAALITFNKIEVKDGFIRNKKCTTILEKARKNIEQKRGAGKASAKKRNALKNNETTPTAVSVDVSTENTTAGATPDMTAVPTNQEPNKKKKINKKRNSADSPASQHAEDEIPPEKQPKSEKDRSHFWFDGEVIGLNERDYHEFLRLYPGNDASFMDWLRDRDNWLSEKPSRKLNWFISTNRALQNLAKQEQTA